MEIMQRKLLRQLQGLSNQVANTAVYVLIGAVPIYMMIERNMLLMNIIRNNTTVEYKILMRQLAMRNEKYIYKYDTRSNTKIQTRTS